MAQSSTEQLKSLTKKVALEADRFMRHELRGSHTRPGTLRAHKQAGYIDAIDLLPNEISACVIGADHTFLRSRSPASSQPVRVSIWHSLPVAGSRPLSEALLLEACVAVVQQRGVDA